MRRTERLGLLLLLVLMSIFFLLVTYPGLDDFTYWRVTSETLTALSEVTNMPLDVLVLLPIQLYPLLVLMAAALRRANGAKLGYLALVGAYLAGSTNFSQFTLWVHWFGFLLFLQILLLVLVRSNGTGRNLPAFSIALIVSIVSLNFISYKLTFFALAFLASLQSVDWIHRYLLGGSRSRSLGVHGRVALIGIVFVLAFNQFVYNQLFASVRVALENPWLGIDWILGVFGSTSTDPLSAFYSHSPTGMIYATLAWLVVLFVALMLCGIMLARRVHSGLELSVGEKAVLASGVAAVLIFVIYTFLGYADLSLAIFVSIIAFATLFARNIRRIRQVAVCGIAVLLLLDLALAAQAVNYQFYNGQRDSSGFKYLAPPSEWYIRFGSSGKSGNPAQLAGLTSDILTCGYIMKTEAEQGVNNPADCHLFGPNELRYLLGLSDPSLGLGDFRGAMFAINYKEPRFAVQGWQFYNSWAAYRQVLDATPYMNRVYSSGDVDLMLVGP